MAIKSQWINPGDSDSSGSRDGDSDHSYLSQSTAPTEYTQSEERPPPIRHNTCKGRLESCYNEWQAYYDESRASTETYASTIPSEDEFSDDDDDEYDLEELSDEFYHSEALASTPREFAELFPSHRRLSIRHDDATIDGNMNLRVDTTRSGYQRPITLFHLRMRDLRTRDFSLRRYCRDSGREVCHSVRQIQKPTSTRRPGLQRPFTDAISHFRHKPSTSSTLSSLNAGHGSMFAEAEARTHNKASDETQSPTSASTNMIKLEFGNYAHVEIKRRGAGSQRRYCFKYWGNNYIWKRQVRREGEFEEVSYHLLRDDKASSIAHIVSAPLTTEQFQEEELRGGWIPPCSMWICDDKIISHSPDVADVIVSTGLMALVDDSIRRKWHSRHHRQLILPLSPSLKMGMEYIGPRRLIDEVFNRGSYAAASRTR